MINDGISFGDEHGGSVSNIKYQQTIVNTAVNIANHDCVEIDRMDYPWPVDEKMDQNPKPEYGKKEKYQRILI